MSALRLLRLFEQNDARWQTKKYSKAAQELSSASFSLWRAAFLADKSGKRTAVFAHSKDFIAKVIEDNAISYPADKSAREWTFNYYTRNARNSLQIISHYWPDVVSKYVGSKMSATERWDYCQDKLDEALGGFERLLDAQAAAKEAKAERSIRRSDTKRKRATVRAMTLASRTADAESMD